LHPAKSRSQDSGVRKQTGFEGLKAPKEEKDRIEIARPFWNLPKLLELLNPEF
jgi:hypothetical protein